MTYDAPSSKQFFVPDRLTKLFCEHVHALLIKKIFVKVIFKTLYEIHFLIKIKNSIFIINLTLKTIH